MIARFLQDIVVNDIEKNMEMTIDKGEELFAIDRGTHYELRKADGWGTMAPKECEGEYYEIIKIRVLIALHQKKKMRKYAGPYGRY